MRETGEEQTLLLQVRATVYAKISGRMFKEEQDPHGRKLFLFMFNSTHFSYLISCDMTLSHHNA